jgi:predicted Zn-dependent peptidase
MPPEEQHVYHHSEGPKLNISVEKNSRGYNYSATVTNASEVPEAMKILKDAVAQLRKEFETEQSVTTP